MKKNFLAYLFFFFLFSCVQEQPLTGGPEDLTPPKLLESSPPNNSTQVNPKKIFLRFDRFVKIENPNQNIIISPRPSSAPIYKLGEKTLQINFEEALAENTTYLLQFGESVRSFRESKAKTENLSLVFSTGQQIDSAVISGRVIDAFTGKTVPQVVIGLYNQLEDSIVSKEKPLYFVKTDSLGQYTLDHIALGKYKIFALLDANKNLIYDNPKEKVGFLDSALNILNSKDTLKDIDFFLFEAASKKQFVKDFSHNQVGKIDFYFNQAFKTNDTVEIVAEPKIGFRSFWNKGKDSLRLWVDLPAEIDENKEYTLPNQIKFKFSSQLFDSIETVQVKLKTLKSKKNADGEELDLLLETKEIKGFEAKPIVFNFNRPIEVVNLDKIKILNKDSIRFNAKVLSYKIDKENPTQVEIFGPWKKGEYYSVELFKNAFIDAYLQTHAIFQGNFTASEDKTTELFSELALKIDFTGLSEGYKAPQYILQIFKKDKKNELVLEKIIRPSLAPIVLDQIPEGAYQMQLIADKNVNGYWDTGDYDQKIQPERVIFYNGDIQLKANFKQELEWKLRL